jgi:protein NrfD
MPLSTVLFLFLAHLGVGIVFILALISRDAGVKFFRFNAGLAATLLVVALSFRFAFTPAGQIEHLSSDSLGMLALVVALAATVLYWATVGRVWVSIRPALVATAIGAGLAAILFQALSVAAGREIIVKALTVASFLSSAALLGGACTAMVLGHWYLVIPSMPVLHLQSAVKLHIASMLLRVVVVAAAVFVALATWQPGAGPSFRRYISSVDGIFFWQRVLFGLAGPAVLSYLTWQTAKIRSTQSATGILYVDFFTVVVGELLAKYIVLATRVPV